MRYRKIASPSHPLIKEAIGVRDRKKTETYRLFIEGRRLLEMALGSGTRILRVFFTDAYRHKHEGFLKAISESGADIIETTEQALLKLADTKTPQGIAAIITYRSFILEELPLRIAPLIVVCDGIQDPGNLGAIIRTSDAAGADAVIILPGTCDPFMPKVIRSTAGSIFNLPILHSEAAALVRWLRGKSISLFSTDVHASKTIYEADLRKPSAFIFGNEAAGVSGNLKKESALLLKIPIVGRAESLNVALSAAILLYEAVRQRGVDDSFII